MKGQQSAETPVAVPASLVWEVYRGLELGRLVYQLLPHVLGKVETLQGHGGVGTIVKLTFPTGISSTFLFILELIYNLSRINLRL